MYLKIHILYLYMYLEYTDIAHLCSWPLVSDARSFSKKSLAIIKMIAIYQFLRKGLMILSVILWPPAAIRNCAKACDLLPTADNRSSMSWRGTWCRNCCDVFYWIEIKCCLKFYFRHFGKYIFKYVVLFCLLASLCLAISNKLMEEGNIFSKGYTLHLDKCDIVACPSMIH